jgi:hypothetical protein
MFGADVTLWLTRTRCVFRRLTHSLSSPPLLRNKLRFNCVRIHLGQVIVRFLIGSYVARYGRTQIERLF